MKSSFSKLLVLAFMIAVLAACGSTNNEGTDSNASEGGDKKVLKMATSADFPPFESRDTKGNFEGFDIDLANLIADELGYELEIEDMKFDGLVGALQSNRVDMVLAGMSADEKRKKNVDFSTEYHRSGEMFLTKPDSAIKDLEALKGKVVGVQLGTIQEEGADALSEEYGFEVKKVDNAGILIQEINSNRIDVAYMDKEVATGYMEKQGLIGFDDPTTSSPGMAVAFPKGSELVEDVNGVLEELEASGKIQELRDKWELAE
ncbi:ABC transporter substrate-binding protein [Oceanobacillus zhaokaii]|uniref:ABC transporter substrate-binding protein n=1 Tax=Oceanobacillus zhaokaii TaxID=2052660 RepID=A0A345PDB0_9BACI|nr:ABC transporter substrate-binding protein [Oceanobacillus zhaokaii]AXI07990.1 ABC transporter substrate-binding protein [Oceanobacillus zhaokaii]